MSSPEISNYLRKILDSLSGTTSITSILQQIRDKVATETTLSNVYTRLGTLATETTQANILSQLQSLVGTFGQAFVTVDRSALALSNGNRYEINYIYSNISDNTTVNMTLENPSSSGKILTLAAIEFVVGGEATLTISKNPSVSSTGTQITPKNQKMGASDSSVGVAYRSSTLTVGSDAQNHLSPSGKFERILGSSNQAPYKQIDQGNTMALQLYNGSGATYDMEIVVIWDEEVVP